MRKLAPRIGVKGPSNHAIVVLRQLVGLGRQLQLIGRIKRLRRDPAGS